MALLSNQYIAIEIEWVAHRIALSKVGNQQAASGKAAAPLIKYGNKGKIESRDDLQPLAEQQVALHLPSPHDLIF